MKGTWTPILISRGGGTSPTYTLGGNYAYYYRMGNMVFIHMSLRVTITNAGTAYAGISGLPFESSIPNTWGYVPLNLGECYGVINIASTNLSLQALLAQPAKLIMIETPDGTSATTWKTGGGGISLSGWYHLS